MIELSWWRISSSIFTELEILQEKHKKRNIIWHVDIAIYRNTLFLQTQKQGKKFPELYFFNK